MVYGHDQRASPHGCFWSSVTQRLLGHHPEDGQQLFLLPVPVFGCGADLRHYHLPDPHLALVQQAVTTPGGASEDLPLKELYVIDGSKRSAHSNAYFYGLPWKKHIVIYDTLIEKSETEEVVAVLSHELGHWSLSHTTKLFGIAQVRLLRGRQ